MTKTNRFLPDDPPSVRSIEAPRLDDYRSVADSTYDWESWVAPDGKLRWVNSAVTRQTGYTIEECFAMAEYPLDLVESGDREWMRDVIAGALDGSSGNDLEFRVRCKDGNTRWASMSWQPIVVRDEPAGYRSSMRDVTERKRLEERLRQTRRQAAEAERAKSLFLANLSHELRTPLQCILSGTELLRDGGDVESEQRWVSIIEEQASVMLRQMDDLLQFVTHTEAPALVSRPVDLHAICRSSVEAIKPRVAPRGIDARCRIASSVPHWAETDPDRLSQVLGNLLSNAAKFTERGSVTLTAQLDDTGRVVLSVSDTGPGIAHENLASVKTPFYRGLDDDGRPRASGAGLGLAVVDRIARQMGGELAITSELGAGTTATVTVPLVSTSPPANAPAADGADMREPLTLTVLVVDDSDPQRELAAELLASLGCSVETCATSEEALERVLERDFDLVLMDFRLMGLDGIRASREIRRRTEVHAIICLLTADAFAASELPKDGPDMVARKPLRRSQLREILSAVASKRMARNPEDEGAGERNASKETPTLDLTIVEELRAIRDEDGRTLFERLGSKVIASVGATLAQLDAARTDLSSSAAGQLAHRAKGDCLTIGARAAATAASNLEEAILMTRHGDIMNALETLRVAWADARVAIELAFDTDRTPRSW